jgi:two-component system, OmpR family, phosphate regulon sensor histidine kinase PhoR
MSDPRPMAADHHARIFHEAQRSADTIFSHYQLSQLLATHALPASMAQAVLDELVHVCDATGGAIWVIRGAGGGPELVARAGDFDAPHTPPDEGPDHVRVDLEDVGVVIVASAPDRPVDAAARRFLALVRHELAIALRAALLRETLERERAELAAVIQGASDAIVLVDADRRVTRVNPAAERMLRRAATSMIGEPCGVALRCGGSADKTIAPACGRRCPFGRVLGGDESIDGAERTVTPSRGEPTSVVGSYAVTARGADGRPQAVGILRDTSELARLAELRRGFLGSISHELRTPLALIKGYVETLLHLEPDEAATRRYLERIDETTNRLGTIVSQILDASQLAADRLDLDIRPVDAGALLEEAAADLAVRHPSLAIRFAVPTSLPTLAADPERLRQVFDNLLSNAAKYGNGMVEIRATAQDGMVAIRVEDGGIGIPEEDRDLVFEQFHRGRNVRQGSVPGSGLGLAISRRVVEAHGGTIGFDADRRSGSAIEVRLPMAALEEVPA